MSKFSLAWHHEAHKNWVNSLAGLKKESSEKIEQIKKDEEELEFYTDQINAATIRGMDGFDSAKLLRKKKRRRLD